MQFGACVGLLDAGLQLDRGLGSRLEKEQICRRNISAACVHNHIYIWPL